MAPFLQQQVGADNNKAQPLEAVIPDRPADALRDGYKTWNC